MRDTRSALCREHHAGRGLRRRHAVSLVGLMCSLALLVAACGGDDGSSSGVDESAPADQETTPDSGGGEATDDTSGLDAGDQPEPERGGDFVYALEAESSGGWCLPEAQLAIAGQQVASTIYDSLVVPSATGEYLPWLAESYEVNDTSDEFTFHIRPGVTFHDGSPLTGEVVKNNMDAWLNRYEGRSSQLVALALSNVDEVQLADEMTVVVTTKTPWPAFVAYLSSPRLGIMAQSQLDSDQCFQDLVGTGPFVLDEWVVNDHLTAERNDDWWYATESGVDYPFFDSIEYRPVPDAPQRVRSLTSGDVDGGHFSALRQIGDLREMAESGEINLVESLEQTDVGYTLLNSDRDSGSPFWSVNARRALAYAMDRVANDVILGDGLGTPASGPFAPGSIGYLEDAGYPSQDLDQARELVAAYEAEAGEPLSFALSVPPSPGNTETAQLYQQVWSDIGADVEIKPVADQSQLINDALAGNFDAMLWRNHAGSEPDGQFFWWHSGFPTNFGRIDDPEIDRLLEEGREETDPDARREIYEDLNRRFADQVYNLWGNWTNWSVATPPNVYGVFGPDLPGGVAQSPGLGDGHPVYGMYYASGSS